VKSVVYLTRSFPHKSETFIVNQIITGINKGYDVGIMTYNYLSPKNSSQEALFLKHQLHQRVDVIDYNIPKNKISKLFSLLRLNALFFKYLHKDKNYPLYRRYTFLPYQVRFFSNFNHVNTFHVHFGNSSFDIVKMKKIGVLKSKLIVSFHGFDAHWEDEEVYKKKKHNYSDTFKYADYITVNSNFLKQKLLNLECPEEKIVVIPMGIDVDFFKNESLRIKQKTDVVRLLSVGRLIELKGHKYAIKAIDLLVSQGYNIEYYIVGNGELYNDLDILIKQLALDKHIKLSGFKSQVEIRELLEQTDIFLMSSTKDKTGRAEAQGQVTAEAQAMGVPVVAFNSGGVKETIIDNQTGILVEDKNVLDFSQSIKFLIDNNELREKMSKNAMKFVKQKFNLKTNTELLFSYY